MCVLSRAAVVHHCVCIVRAQGLRLQTYCGSKFNWAAHSILIQGCIVILNTKEEWLKTHLVSETQSRATPNCSALPTVQEVQALRIVKVGGLVHFQKRGVKVNHRVLDRIHLENRAEHSIFSHSLVLHLLLSLLLPCLLAFSNHFLFLSLTIIVLFVLLFLRDHQDRLTRHGPGGQRTLYGCHPGQRHGRSGRRSLWFHHRQHHSDRRQRQPPQVSSK